jgi:hypothetical protein
MTLVYDVECQANYNTYWFEIKYQGETWQVYDKEDGKWLASYLHFDEVEESPIFDDYQYLEFTSRSRVVA